MSDPLVFMMGEFEASIPNDRQFAKNHMWAQSENDGIFRFGFSAYAVRLLQDVYFLDWTVDVDSKLRAQQAIGAVESSKAESELYAPIGGILVRLNEGLLVDPAMINVEMYGRGWLFEIEGLGDDLLTPVEYIEHLRAVWEIAQRTIKGQLG